MKVKAYIAKNVMDQVFQVIQTLVQPDKMDDVLAMRDLINFIGNCDEWVCQDHLWLDNPNEIRNNLIRILGQKGKRPIIAKEQSQFDEILNNSVPFGIQIIDDENDSLSEKLNNSPIPTVTLAEFAKTIKRRDKNSFAITNTKDVLNDFRYAAFKHHPSSIILNDRYLFTSSDTEEVLNRILGNFIDKKSAENIVCTIFYSEPPYMTIEKVSKKISDLMRLEFPNAEIKFELIEVKKFNSNHDRILFTDFVCYKSGHSFTFLSKISRPSTTIERYLLIDKHNFTQNIKLLEAMLNGALKEIRKAKSQNRIIKEHFAILGL